jgi:O-methyltransferase
MMHDDVPELYIDLLKRMLTRSGFSDGVLREATFERAPVLRPFQALLRKSGLFLARPVSVDTRGVEYGRGAPSSADTMLGFRRLNNLHNCIRTIIDDRVPGDLVETGVWRGGASIFMKGVLTAYGERRDVWLADSFEGFPPPDVSNYPEDAGVRFHDEAWLQVSVEEVKRNFERYGLLDDNVHFVKGWFRDTLGTLPVEQIALLRLDGDLYESTVQALEPLYPRIPVGGFCVIDDYLLEPCRKAVHDFRTAHGITEPIIDIDGSGVFWRKTTNA